MWSTATVHTYIGINIMDYTYAEALAYVQSTLGLTDQQIEELEEYDTPLVRMQEATERMSLATAELVVIRQSCV